MYRFPCIQRAPLLPIDGMETVLPPPFCRKDAITGNDDYGMMNPTEEHCEKRCFTVVYLMIGMSAAPSAIENALDKETREE